MELQAFKQIRRAELELVEPHCGRPPSLLVELGAGAGWQARLLAEHGFRVRAFDLDSDSLYANASEFNVEAFDGYTLPLKDSSVDLVYSSHVLEHVEDLPRLLKQVRRVLGPNGRMLAVLPTPSWRLWNILFHYFGVLVELKRALGRGPEPAATPSKADALTALSKGVMGQKRSLRALCLRALYPHRHGACGTSLGELRLFSRRHWRRRLESLGWGVDEAQSLGLFYTGYLFLGQRLSIARRRQLAWLLGSSSQLFVVRPGPLAAPLAEQGVDGA